tara:strand:- start:30 stop:464 length:435 start_codon:yes stop_codon:yes gene_type:complete
MPRKKTIPKGVYPVRDVLTNELSKYHVLEKKCQKLSEEEQRSYRKARAKGYSFGKKELLLRERTMAKSIDIAAEEEQKSYELVLTAVSEVAKVIFKEVNGKKKKSELLKIILGQGKADEIIRNILADEYDILDLEDAIIIKLEL